jgi:hypothetical protein
VSPVKYELGFYIPEDGILHSHRRENLNSHILSCCYYCPISVSEKFPVTGSTIYQKFHKNKLQLKHKGNGFFVDTSSESFTPHTKGALLISVPDAISLPFIEVAEVKTCRVKFTLHK